MSLPFGNTPHICCLATYTPHICCLVTYTPHICLLNYLYPSYLLLSYLYPSYLLLNYLYPSRLLLSYLYPSHLLLNYLYTLEWAYPLVIYRIVGKFGGRKLSQISQFCSHLRKFSPQNLGMWRSLAQQKWAICESFLHAIVFFTNLWKFSPLKVSHYTIPFVCTHHTKM